MTGPTLPPGRARRGQLLLSRRLHPRDADPLELAYATRHVLTHRDLDADAWRRDRTDAALAELRASLGDWPRALFGESTLRALVVRLAPGECGRCRANMIAHVRRLPPPPRNPATAYLLGHGCDRCKPKSRSTRIRPGGAALASSQSAPLARSTPERLADWIVREAAPDPVLSTAVRKLLGDQPLPGSLGPGAPPISDEPVHPAFRR